MDEQIVRAVYIGPPETLAKRVFFTKGDERIRREMKDDVWLVAVHHHADLALILNVAEHLTVFAVLDLVAVVARRFLVRAADADYRCHFGPL